MTKNLSPVTVVWLRRDLRLADNPALCHAAQRGAILPLYILTEDKTNPWPLGDASRWWLHHSLNSLQRDLAARQIPLVLRRGAPLQILRDIAKTCGATAVTWNKLYEPFESARDERIAAALQADGLQVTSHKDYLLFEPAEIATKSSGPFRVFTPFWRHCLTHPASAPLPVPTTLQAAQHIPASDTLDAWNLLPTQPNWAKSFAPLWIPGETGAQERLADFLGDGGKSYSTGRDNPAADFTSRLSPALHFGEISPRAMRASLEKAAAHGLLPARESEAILRQLFWREFSAHLLHHFPSLPETPLDRKFSAFPWKNDGATLRAWQKGLTGYPIVDAGMRQLWQTGWMHNRVRMIVASFLIKDLLIDWREGQKWFWDTLLDADLANNAASWQWVAGCGADAAPYFRIFNPVLQGKKFDPDGTYVRRYVPELTALPTCHIHEPWRAPTGLLHMSGIKLGVTYPSPILDHAMARNRALAVFHGLPKLP